MKKLLLIAIAFIFLVSNESCKKFINSQDISPNAASNASAPLLLSASELAVFATYGGSISRNTSIWVQQSAGCQFQSQAVDEYALDEGDVANEWQVIYNGLKNAKFLKEKAGPENPYYQGISDVVTALLVGAATDLWGDVPFRDALKGESGKFTAEYDPQSQVIQDIQDSLTLAIQRLSNANNLFFPGTDDYIYGGDVKKWKALAYLLKARYAMRISKRDANWHVNALKYTDSAMVSGFTNSDFNANCVFGNKSNEYNQWYAFVKVERTGYIYAGKKFVDTMVSIQDPRVAYYFTQNDSGKYAGSALGTYNTTNVSEIGPAFGSKNSPTPLATFSELLFIRAEAFLAAGNKTEAANAHNNAIKSHVLNITGVPASGAFLTSQANETSSTISLSKIMFHKYIATYTMLEAFNDWRRTGIPTLTKNPKSSLGAIARRYPSSIEERLYNAKAAGFIFGINDLATAKVWWDN
jgi:Starch-binding associating with outer membrane